MSFVLKELVMKMKSTMLLVACLVFALVAGANAAPLVKLDFDDAPALSTVNQGSLGGTQALSGYNGWGAKDSVSASAPTTFDSDTSWWSMFVSGAPAATYGDYQLPTMSATTVALWVKPGHFLSWRNIFASESASGMELGAWFESSTLHFTSSAGNLDVTGVFTVGTWTHIAFTYDSTGAAGNEKVYINGVDTALTSGGLNGSAIAAGTNGITIGTFPAGAYGFNGLLDNLVIYNTVLTEAQVNEVMMTNVPEPTTMVLLAVGAFGLIRRRK